MTSQLNPKTSVSGTARVRTPCIGVCSTGIGDAVCRGCKRFSHEVIDWNAYTEVEKAIVDERLAHFLSLCMQNKFVVTDPGLLRWQLQTQQIRFNPAHDQYCGLFALLKAGASQIKEPEAFGFSIHLLWRNSSLTALRESVDQEFWSLSDAHHQRYLATPDLFESN
ncbi:MAG: DUF1289 domain-containing protein [Luminiphilus sp.]|jgi:predicted Fe-S protein YdhL (DUF1289 family)|nr:DUF1289 domain-containing protein [Luminiphilus sp.]